jgi:hypothetical protein
VNDLVKDICTKMFVVHIENEWKPNQSFIRSSWEPIAANLPPEFCACVTCFMCASFEQPSPSNVQSRIRRHAKEDFFFGLSKPLPILQSSPLTRTLALPSLNALHRFGGEPTWITPWTLECTQATHGSN